MGEVGRLWSSMTKSRSFGGQNGPNLGTSGVPSHSEVTGSVIVQPKFLTLAYCCSQSSIVVCCYCSTVTTKTLVNVKVLL